MEKENIKENILPPMKNINLMDLFPNILNVEKETFKMTPSEYIKQMSMTMNERHKSLIRISGFLKSTNYPPDFRIVPHILMFQRFEAMSTNTLVLEVKNVGKSLLSVRMRCPESIYFSASFLGTPTNKIAPGLSVEYEITFTPKEEKDYQHHLVFMSKEETFQVPIVAIGPRPMLDVPDQIILNPSPVKISTSKFIVVRNIGNTAAVFNFIPQGEHFQVSPAKGILAVNDSMLLNLSFKSAKVEDVTELLQVGLETGERFLVTLHGSAENISVRLEKNSVVHDDTFMGLKRCKTVRLINNSCHVIKFSWKKNKTEEEDLNIIERMRDKYKELSEIEKLKDNKVIFYGLGDAEQHKISCERILNDELRFLEKEEFQFFHEAFSILPLKGEVWPKTSAELMISFQPKTCGSISVEAYLEVSGRNSRLPLRLKGNGLGPKIVLNVKTLDIDCVFLHSQHKYEVSLENIGDIPGTVEYVPETLVFGGKIEIIPDSRHLKAGELGAFYISFMGNRPGEFTERLFFNIKESQEQIYLVLKGNVIYPSLHFGIKQLDFGVVPFGVPVKKEVTLFNLSVVPVNFTLRVSPDGDVPSISRTKFSQFTIKPSVPRSPKEFDLDPEEGVVEPLSNKQITVTLTPNKKGRHHKQLTVDLWDNENGSESCPIEYKVKTPDIKADSSNILLPFCYINYPYTKTIVLKNKSSISGFFYIIPRGPNEESSITFSVSISQGVLEPLTSINIDLTIITSALGKQECIIHMLTFGNDEPEEICIVTFISQGPVVVVEPQHLNWGEVNLLDTATETINCVNESPIPAHLTLSTVKSSLSGLWKIEPSNILIEPQKSEKVSVSVYLKDCGKFKDVLKVNIYNGKPVEIPLQATGVGSSLVITPSLNPTYCLGTLYTQKSYEITFTIVNMGSKTYNLVWSPTSDYKKFVNSKCVIPQDKTFKIRPTCFDIPTNETKTMTLEVFSKNVGKQSQTYYCFANVDTPVKELSFTSEISAQFVEPMVFCDKKEILFVYDESNNKKEAVVNETLVLTNKSILPIDIELITHYPFYLEMEPRSCNLKFECSLSGLESKEINVKFMAEPNPNKISQKHIGKLTIEFKGLSKAIYVGLIGKMSYPNLSIQPKYIDFGYVQVGTNACAEIKITNTGPLPVSYVLKWNTMSSYVVPFEKTISGKSLIPELSKASEGIAEFEGEKSLEEEAEEGEAESFRHGDVGEAQPSSITLMKPVLRMPEIEISSSDIKAALFPLARNYFNCDYELTEAYKLVRSSDFEYPESPLNFTNYCDITPFYGTMEPHCCQILTVAFFSNTPVHLCAEALLQVKSGPEEVIKINAISSEIDFQLSTTELDFGKQLFCETVSEVLKLQNTGAMPFFYEAETKIECRSELEKRFPLGKGMMTVTPSSGTLGSFEAVELTVRYHPGVPGQFKSDFQLLIAHLDPITITLKGIGVFPQVYFTLPRPDMLKIIPETGYFATAGITPDWILTNFKSESSLCSIEKTKPYRSRDSNVDAILEEDSNEENWEIIKGEELMPSEVDIYLAIEREMAYNLVPKDSNSAIFAVYARTISGFSVPPYELDFGVCLIGNTVEQRVAIANFGPLPVIIYGTFDSTSKEEGIYFRLKNRNELKTGACISFVVSFHPTKQIYNQKYQILDSQFFFEIYHGPKVPIRIRAEVTYPYVVPSMFVINFNEVICGCCKVINLRLKNPGLVVAHWSINGKKKEIPGVENFATKDGNSMFYLDKYSGTLEPGEYCTVQLFFKPENGDSFSTFLNINVVKGLERLKILLLGSGIEPTLNISKKVLDFKSTLPFPNKSETVFSVCNPCSFPVEFSFPEFDEQIFEEERILRAILFYYETNEILLPVRKPGESLPIELIDFYNLLLESLNAKLVEEEKEKISAEREMLEENLSASFSFDDENLGSSQTLLSEKKKKRFKRVSRSRTSMETCRELMGTHSNGRDPSTMSIFKNKTPDEIQLLLEEHVQYSLCKDYSAYDPVQDALKSVLPPEKEEEYTEGTLIICYGAPYTNSVLLANKLALKNKMLAASIDEIVLMEAAFGRCEAGLKAKDLIEQAYSEFAKDETNPLTPYGEWEESDCLHPEDTFNFANCYEEIKKKFNALIKLREDLSYGKKNSGGGESAKSESAKKTDKASLPSKPQMNLNGPIANISQDLVVEILRYRLALEVNEGLIIEGLESILVNTPTNALISLLKAAGNIKDILVIVYWNNFQKYKENLLNEEAARELEKLYYREQILNILEEEPIEVFEDLNLPQEDADEFREIFLTNRRESFSVFEKKKEVFYKIMRLRKEALKKGLGIPMNITIENNSQTEKKENGKKKETGKGVKVSEPASKKSDNDSKSGKAKPSGVEAEFTDFETHWNEMKSIINNWDQRLGAIVIDSPSEGKSKKGQTPRKESVATNILESARGIFLWFVDVTKPSSNSIEACCCHLKTSLENRVIPLESDAWPIAEPESLTFSVVSLPLERIRDPPQSVFTISATDHLLMTGEEFDDEIDDYPGTTSNAIPKLNRSHSSLSIKSKKKDSRASRRRKTESRMSVDVKSQKTRKSLMSAAEFDETQVKPRWILMPGETQCFRVKYYPTEIGLWTHDYLIDIVIWKNTNVVRCKGFCDFPRIDVTPEALFPEVKHDKPSSNMYIPAYYYSEEAYDFGPVLICPQNDERRFGGKTIVFNLHNISTLPVDLNIIFGGGESDSASSDYFTVVPNKLWIMPGSKKEIFVTANPTRTGSTTETILLVIKDNPKIESIKLKLEGIKANVTVNPKVLNFDRVLLYRKDFRRLILTNDHMIPLFFILVGVDNVPTQFSFTNNCGWIPPSGFFDLQVYYTADQIQLINGHPVYIQIYDSEDATECAQELGFELQAEAYDAALDIIFANEGDDHIDFGDIRVESQYSVEFNLKNVGKYQLGFKFDIDYAVLCESGSKDFFLIPQEGKLAPGKPFPVAVTFLASSEIFWDRKCLFKILLVEPFSGDELIAAIPVEVTARSHYSRYEIKPMEQLNFGHIPVGSVTSNHLLIENTGHFSLTYFIELHSVLSTMEEKGSTRTKRSSKLSSSSKEKVDKGKKNTFSVLKAGSFEISSCAGVVESGQTAVVGVSCFPNEVKKCKEKVQVLVNESPPYLKKGITVTITAESCLPMIRLDDYNSVFREHIVCKDETEFHCRSKPGSHTIYTTNNNLFSFKNICVNKTAKARLHLQNAGLIDCCLTAIVTAQKEETKNTNQLSTQTFSVSPEKLIIEPYNFGSIFISFTPEALEDGYPYLKLTNKQSNWFFAFKVYTAQLTITLEMPNGFEKVEQVFDLCGTGILPQIEITEPNTKLPEGQALVNFPPTCTGRTSTSSIAFANTGVLECKVIIELYKQIENAVFTLTPKPSTEKMLKIWELAKPIDHTVMVTLSPGAVAEFHVTFNPVETRTYKSQIKLFIVDNPFENWSYKLVGEVFFEEVIVEKIRTSMPFLNDETDNTSSALVAPGQYFINFGDCYVKKKSKVLFRLSNKTEKDYFKFEWNEASSITLSPSTGHLYPNSYKEVLLVFQPDEPMELDCMTLSCTLNKIAFKNLPELSWDSRLTLCQNREDKCVRSNEKISAFQYPLPEVSMGSLEEPVHEIIPEFNRQIFINLSGIADYTRLTCETKNIFFKNTFMFQTRIYPLVLENSGNVALEYKVYLKSVVIWPLKENKTCQVDEQFLMKLYRSNSRPQSSLDTRPSNGRLNSRCGKRSRPATSVIDFRSLSSGGELEEQPSGQIPEEPTPTHFNPFAIENATGRILSKEKASCNIVFSPMDVNEYKTTITIQVANLHPDCSLSEIEVTASSIMPYCHFDVPESDYLESGRRECSRPGPIGFCPGVPLPADTRTIEVKVLGVGLTTPIKFYGINPTEEDYTFSWINTTQTQPDIVPSFHCSTMDGWIQAGRQQLMVFNFVSQKIGITESFWNFIIPKYGVETPFLFVGDVREPSVYFLTNHINLTPTLTGCTSTDLITLVNHEDTSFEFCFVPESVYSEGRLNVLSVVPHSGKILPNSEMSIRVGFTGRNPGKTYFTLKCKVKNIKEPFAIPVEATTYAVQPLVTFEDQKKVKHQAGLNVQNIINFGSELNPQIPETVTLSLSSLSKTAFYYEWEYEEKTLEMQHCSLDFSVKKGHVTSLSKGKCNLSILFTKTSHLRNFPVKLKIRRGPTFHFLISGEVSTIACELSFTNYDFGYCFLQEKDIAFYKTSLIVRNKNTTDLCLECDLPESSTFSYLLTESVIPPMKEISIPLSFHPKDYVSYEDQFRLIINGVQERNVRLRGHGTPFKVVLADPEDTIISLGAVKIGKTITRELSLINKSLAEATLLVGFSDQLPVSGSYFTEPQYRPLDLSQDHRLTGVITISPPNMFRIKPQEAFTLTVTYAPQERTPPFSETICFQCQEKSGPLCIVTGCSLGVDISLDKQYLNFGAVVESCTSELRLKLMNSGSIGARFEWKCSDLIEYRISPEYGYCSPESDVTITVTFCPPAIQNCIKKSVECELYLSDNEKYPSLCLGLTGDCIAIPEPKDVVDFECIVRETITKEIIIENPSGSEWQLMPVISGEQFWGDDFLIVPALSSAVYKVEYKPLTMSAAGRFHEGSAFFKLPNGKGLLYRLKGISLAPEPEGKIERDVPCKTKYVELLKIKNWLQCSQRFRAVIVQIDNQNDPSTICTGLEYLEVPGLAQKEYTLNFFSYNVGNKRFQVKFVNEETEEYVWYELEFNVSMCGPLELITLKSGVRETCRQEIKLENPLDCTVEYKLETTSEEVHLEEVNCVVPPQQSVYVTISFTPIHPGEKTVVLNASCLELGVFPRELRLIASEVAPSHPVKFETPLGTSQELEFPIKNFSKTSATLVCKVNSDEFSVKESGNVEAGQMTNIKVKYEPTEIGSTPATFFVESEQAGNFVFPLLGTCVKPLAKGPFILKPGAGVSVPFKNVFKKAKEFHMYVDNHAFYVKTAQETLLPREESKIFVGFQKMKHLERLSEYQDTEINPKFPMMGQLVVECFNPYVKWQFYLKGVLES